MVWYRQDIFFKFREAQFQFFLGLENFYDFPFNLFNVSCVRSFFLFRHCCYSFLRATARFWHPKLMLGFIGFVVYAVYDTSKRQSAQQTSGRISSPPPQQSNYQIGDNVPVGYMGYKIVGVRWNDQLTKNPYLNARPNSHYLVVEIFVVNMDKKARTIPPFHLVDANGAEYDTTSNGAYLDDAIHALDSLNPEVAKRGTIVFDVPKDRTYKLKLSGGYWSRDDAYVELAHITDFTNSR